MFLWRHSPDEIINDLRYTLGDENKKLIIKTNKSDFDFITSNPKFKVLIDSIGNYSLFSYMKCKHKMTGSIAFGICIYFYYEPDLYTYEERYPLDFIVNEHTVLLTEGTP